MPWIVAGLIVAGVLVALIGRRALSPVAAAHPARGGRRTVRLLAMGLRLRPRARRERRDHGAGHDLSAAGDRHEAAVELQRLVLAGHRGLGGLPRSCGWAHHRTARVAPDSPCSRRCCRVIEPTNGRDRCVTAGLQGFSAAAHLARPGPRLLCPTRSQPDRAWHAGPGYCSRG